MIKNTITLEEITDGLDPEIYLDFKDELIALVGEYNNAENIDKQDQIDTRIQNLIGKIRDENSLSHDFYGHTTTRHAHGNQRSGKYRSSGMDVGPINDSE